MATVLLHIYKERETMWTSCVEPENATLIPNQKKNKTPVLITNAIDHGAFISSEKVTIKEEEDRIFFVAFPGYDV